MKRLLTSYYQFGFGILIFGFVVSCSTSQYTKHYSGDGEIQEVRAPILMRNGYTVRFKPMTLGRPVYNVYRFTGLPKIAPHVEACFVFDDPRNWTSKEYSDRQQRNHPDETNSHVIIADLQGSLSISLRDSNGTTILDVSRKLSDFGWTEVGSGHWLLNSSNLLFIANPHADYVLEVTTDFEPMLAGIGGQVLLKSGLWGK